MNAKVSQISNQQITDLYPTKNMAAMTRISPPITRVEAYDSSSLTADILVGRPVVRLSM
jgi:hypothetical protein